MGKVLHVLAHMAYGCLSGYFWWVDRAAAVFVFLLFIIYEVVQQAKVKDELYHELKEFAAGFAIGLTGHYAFIALTPLV